MTLTIIDAEQDWAAAARVVQTVRSMRPGFQGDADMGGFWISRNTGESHALTTCGAGPCTIIVIRASDGSGGLGHYGGDHKAQALLRGLQAMVGKLGAPHITDILFAAGEIGAGDHQANFDRDLVVGAQALYPAATVSRVVYCANGGVAGEAVYLPRQGIIALFDSSPGRFWGTGGEDGLESGHYPG